MSPEQFIAGYEAALATQDWQSVSPYVHQDACVTFSTGDFYQGKAEVQKAYERNFRLIQDEEYSIFDLQWVGKTEHYAVCIYAFRWQGIINGEPARGSGRGTATIIMEDGKWYLLAEHLGPTAK
jgi:ketosteroid isomerase-like protein